MEKKPYHHKNLKNDYKIINLEKSGHFYYDEDELNKILKVLDLDSSQLAISNWFHK